MSTTVIIFTALGLTCCVIVLMGAWEHYKNNHQ